MYEETLATYRPQSAKQYTGNYFPLKFYDFFFPDIKHTWTFQHLYGLPILSQDGTVFEHPRKMSDFSNLCDGEGCPLSLMEERATACPQEEGEWPQPKP